MRRAPMNVRAALVLMQQRLVDDERGTTAIEYALVASGIAVAVAAAVFALGSETNNLFAKVSGLF
jgi:Flp pilus assembly pilin Flp